jgi:hypothetical protein
MTRQHSTHQFQGLVTRGPEDLREGLLNEREGRRKKEGQ